MFTNAEIFNNDSVAAQPKRARSSEVEVADQEKSPYLCVK